MTDLVPAVVLQVFESNHTTNEGLGFSLLPWKHSPCYTYSRIDAREMCWWSTLTCKRDDKFFDGYQRWDELHDSFEWGTQFYELYALWNMEHKRCMVNSRILCWPRCESQQVIYSKCEHKETFKMSTHHSRSLGNVKVSKGIMFPPLTQALNQTNRSYFQEHDLMIHGDGVKGASPMSPRGLEEELRTRRGSSTRPMTSRKEQMNARAAEELKELQVLYDFL